MFIFISLPDLFPLAPTNRLWVSEDGELWLTTWRPESMWMPSTKASSTLWKSLGKPNLPLKEQQYEILKAVVMMKRDVLAILPTGFGKSLIYQSLGFIFDFLRSGSDSQHAAIVVVSPLNALMQDQVEKLMAYTNVCVMKANTDLADSSSDLRQSAQIIFAHPEVFVQSQVMRDKTLQKSVRAVVIDEAHLGEEW